MVVLLGAVMYSAGVLATSFVPDLAYAYLTFGVIAGLGANFIFQAGIVLIIAWFTGTSSRGTSLALLGSSFGESNLSLVFWEKYFIVILHKSSLSER